MKAKELVTLLKCPKKYELERLSLNSENQKYKVFEEALQYLSQQFIKYQKWEQFESKLNEHFQQRYHDSWFELVWQKTAAIREDLLRLRRMYQWLMANMEGKMEATQSFFMAYAGICNEHPIDGLSVRADLVIERVDGGVTGVILHRKFPKAYSYRAQKLENKVFYAVELLCLMEVLCKKYPKRPIQVLMVSTISKRDKPGSLAIFEDRPGDNVIGFTLEELKKVVGNNILDALQKVINERALESCQTCIFEDLCKPATKLFLKKQEEIKPKQIEDMVYTENQLKVIHHLEGPIRVCAGPGAGKTATLVARIQFLIDSGVNPDKILAVTFTKKAAKEILERIRSEKKPIVSTLHALGFQIVRQHEFLVGKKRLVSRVDCMQMLLQVLNHAPVVRDVSYEGLSARFGLLNSLKKDIEFINRFGKHEFAKAYPKKDIVGILRIKEIYDQKFTAAGYILFEDQIKLAVNILKEYSGARKRVQDAFQYILVDEVQDLDQEQSEFVQLLVKGPCSNIAICGDADQSIYGFRGGSNRFMLDFMNIYPEAKDVWLDDNFRSSKEILETANTLINHNECRVPIRMKASFDTGVRATLISNFHANRIGRLVCDLIKKGYRQEDITIIARTNKDLACMCDMLDLYNVQQQGEEILRYDRPKYYLYQDFTFQVVLDLLSLYLGEMKDDWALYRLLISLGIQPKKQDKEKCLYEDYLARNEIFSMYGDYETRYLMITEKDSLILQAFAKIYRTFKLFSLPVAQAVPKIIDCFCNEQIDNQVVEDIILEMIEDRQMKEPIELFNYMTAVKKFKDDTRVSYSSGNKNQLHLLTAHDSKGREFPIVLVYGVDTFEKDIPQEDRRLLYVALTRAKKILLLTEICKGKSTFLKEIEANIEVMGGARYA